MGQILAISNQKGGVGKTTTAVNLSASLAVLEKKVLIIDLDPQANAGSGLGLSSKELRKGIYNVLVEELPIEEAIYRTELKFLDIVPSCQDLIGAEIELVSAFGRETRLKDALESVKDLYEWIVIDCPPALGLLTVNALTASDGVLIPLQTEYYAMEGLSQLLKTIELIKRRLNPNLVVDGILLTMVDRRNNLCKQVEADIRGHFGSLVYSPVIPRNIKLTEAPSHGKPIVLYDVTSVGCSSYMALAQMLNSKPRGLERDAVITQVSERNNLQGEF